MFEFGTLEIRACVQKQIFSKIRQLFVYNFAPKTRPFTTLKSDIDNDDVGTAYTTTKECSDEVHAQKEENDFYSLTTATTVATKFPKCTYVPILTEKKDHCERIAKPSTIQDKVDANRAESIININ